MLYHPAGSWKSSSLVSRLLSVIFSLTVLVVLSAMTHKYSSCKTARWICRSNLFFSKDLKTLENAFGKVGLLHCTLRLPRFLLPYAGIGGVHLLVRPKRVTCRMLLQTGHLIWVNKHTVRSSPLSVGSRLSVSLIYLYHGMVGDGLRPLQHFLSSSIWNSVSFSPEMNQSSHI